MYLLVLIITLEATDIVRSIGSGDMGGGGGVGCMY